VPDENSLIAEDDGIIAARLQSRIHVLLFGRV